MWSPALTRVSIDVVIAAIPAATDVDALAAGAEPQWRVIRNAPKDVSREDLKSLFGRAMKYW